MSQENPETPAIPSGSAHEVVTTLIERGLTIATAESLTAGLLAATIADVPGASATLQGGIVSYQNSVKHRLLGVDQQLLDTAGAVDPETARQMALGAQRELQADIGIATTGVAGPEPHQGKPVGTVFVGLAFPGRDPRAIELHLSGDRQQIRHSTVTYALSLIQEACSFDS